MSSNILIQYGVLAFCTLVCAISAVGLAFPTALWRRMRSLWQERFALPLAVGMRLLLGMALILFAPESRFPSIFRLFGTLGLAAAVGLCLVGWRRIDAFMRWVGERPGMPIRMLWAVSLLIGAVLLYGAI